MVDVDDFPLGMPGGDMTEPMMQIPSELPCLPLRDIVIYPFMIVPLFAGQIHQSGRRSTKREPDDRTGFAERSEC